MIETNAHYLEDSLRMLDFMFQVPAKRSPRGKKKNQKPGRQAPP